MAESIQEGAIKKEVAIGKEVAVKKEGAIKRNLKILETILRSIESGDRDYQKALTKMIEWYKKKMESRQPFTILIIGQTGSGKSTLINNILGDESAAVNDGVDSKTPGNKKYRKIIRGVEVKVYDTPGLQDTNHKDKEILEDIKELIDRNAFSVVIFCFKITENRRLEQTIENFKKYHDIGIPWNKAVVALTFADRLTKDDGPVEEHVQKWKDSIRNDILVEEVGLTPQTAHEIAFRPTTKRPDIRPLGNKNWFVPLWFSVLRILEPRAMMDFMMLHVQQGMLERASLEGSVEGGTLDFIIRQKENSFNRKIARVILKAGEKIGLFSRDKSHGDSDTEHDYDQQMELDSLCDFQMVEDCYQ